MYQKHNNQHLGSNMRHLKYNKDFLYTFVWYWHNRIETEEKAKNVACVWWTEFNNKIPCLVSYFAPG